MSFQFLPAIVAGLAGGAVMTMMITAARRAGMTEMDMALIQGAMATGDRQKAKVLGLFTHLVVMSALVFGTIYGLLFAAFAVAEDDAWWVGAVFGAVHAVVAGIAFAMMPVMHPRMGGHAAAAGAGARGVWLESPGPFGKNYGSVTPAGVVMAHVVYGVTVALVYAWLV